MYRLQVTQSSFVLVINFGVINLLMLRVIKTRSTDGSLVPVLQRQSLIDDDRVGIH